MSSRLIDIYNKIKQNSTDSEFVFSIEKEIELIEKLQLETKFSDTEVVLPENLYQRNDISIFVNHKIEDLKPTILLKTLDELIDKDKQRENDGFPRRIRLGKYIKPSKDNKEQIVVVPTTYEPKFYHDSSITEEEEEGTGGSGEGDEGEVIGEQKAQPEKGEGEGEGAGQGEGANHEVNSQAFDLGKLLTEKFQLPNLKTKGKKASLTKYQYDLTDINRGFGQLLDKKSTLKKVIETNILLGNIKPGEPIDTDKIIINPQDQIFRILSREKDYESEAIVFFIRDYSGSMQGKPSEVVVTQHLFIYSWLMYQYQKNVKARFILHDTEAKEVPDFYTYYQSAVAGGTNVFPSYELVLNIIEKENLAKDYNIYIFQGTDGDDWEDNGTKAIELLRKLIVYTNRIGITIAKNSWSTGSALTTVEKYIEKSNLLKEKSELIRMDTMVAEEANEARIIEGIKKLVS